MLYRFIKSITMSTVNLDLNIPLDELGNPIDLNFTPDSHPNTGDLTLFYVFSALPYFRISFHLNIMHSKFNLLVDILMRIYLFHVNMYCPLLYLLYRIDILIKTFFTR